MNAAFFLKPKSELVYLIDDMPLAQGMDILRRNGFTSVPVIDREGIYICAITEGDMLMKLTDVREGRISMLPARAANRLCVGDVLRRGRCPACRIDEPPDALLARSVTQNYVPIIDDRGIFIGIVTRQMVIEHLLKYVEKQ